MKELRRERLKALLNGPRFNGDRAAFCAAADITNGRLTQLLDPEQPFGDTADQNLRDKLELPDGFFTKPFAVEETTTYLLAPGAKASNPALASKLRAGTAINLIENIYPVEFSIPLLSWVRAGAFCEAPGSFTREDAQELLPRPLFRTGPNTFALTVVGDSMDVPDGYREGEIVYIDPDIEPTPGKDVLAKADGKMTLKRYKVDDEGPYLLQLNGNRIIRPTDWSVCGVVVYAGRRC